MLKKIYIINIYFIIYHFKSMLEILIDRSNNTFYHFNRSVYKQSGLKFSSKYKLNL